MPPRETTDEGVGCRSTPPVFSSRCSVAKRDFDRPLFGVPRPHAEDALPHGRVGLLWHVHPFALRNLTQRRDIVVVRPRHFPVRKHLPHRDAGCPNVRLFRKEQVLHRFWGTPLHCHLDWCLQLTVRSNRVLVVTAARPGHPEIGNFDTVVRTHEAVSCSQVHVNQAAVRHVLHATR